VGPATAAAQPAANPAPPPTAAAQAAARAALLKKGRMLGYHPVERNGQTVYCHNEAPLGSRFEKTSCLSEDDLAAAMQRRDAMQDDMTRPGTCGRAGCVTH
jgi:hypothetical protein